jgi:hypothetical protein
MGLATIPDTNMIVRPKTLGSGMIVRPNSWILNDYGSDIFVRSMAFVNLIFLSDPRR